MAGAAMGVTTERIPTTLNTLIAPKENQSRFVISYLFFDASCLESLYGPFCPWVDVWGRALAR